MTTVRRGARTSAPAPRSGGTPPDGPEHPDGAAPDGTRTCAAGPPPEHVLPTARGASARDEVGRPESRRPKALPSWRGTGHRGVPAPSGPPDIEASVAAPAPAAGPTTDGPTTDGSAEELVRALVTMAPGAPGAAAARERVVAAHLPLVEALARRYTGRGEPYDDLVQVGTIGLLTALDRFDPARGVPLGAFAVPHVLGEIRRHFRDRGWAVRVPRRLQEHGRAVADARTALTQSLGRSPTVAEVARACDLDVDLVVAALDSAGAYATVPLEDDQSGSSSLGAEDSGLSDVEDRLLLRPLLEALPARERRIIALRFVRGLSQAQIAAEVGISQMHVSRLLARTLATLRTQLADGHR